MAIGNFIHVSTSSSLRALHQNWVFENMIDAPVSQNAIADDIALKKCNVLVVDDDQIATPGPERLHAPVHPGRLHHAVVLVVENPVMREITQLLELTAGWLLLVPGLL